MQKHLYPLLLLLCCSTLLTAQLRLNVAGDAQINGRLELWPSPDDNTSLVIGKDAGLTTDFSVERFNTLVGSRAGYANSTGNRNTFVGQNAGEANTTGYSNVFIGRWAGLMNTEGYRNTFLGASAGRENTTARNNIAIGNQALALNTDRPGLIAIGLNALFNNGTGATDPNDAIRNVAIGTSAGYSNTLGSSNTFLGFEAGFSNTSAGDNTFLGSRAGYTNTGGGNTFVGTRAGEANSTGLRNTFMGTNAGRANTEGIYNTFLGNEAGLFNTTGEYNTFVGAGAGDGNQAASNNTVVGALAATKNATGGDNTMVGARAGFDNTAGNRNTFVGHSSGEANTTGYSNTFVGRWSGLMNTEGHSNTFLGASAGKENTTGINNIAIGRGALLFNTDRPGMVAIGFNALHNNGTAASDPTHAIRNTAVGTGSGYTNKIGSYNTFIGFDAGYYNSDGSQNSFVGEWAGRDNSTGNNNAFLGTIAGRDNSTGSNNTFLGRAAGFNNTVGSNLTFVGQGVTSLIAGGSNGVGIGSQARLTASDQIVLGNSAIQTIRGTVNWSSISDGRYKRAVKEDVPGIDFIRSLRPVTYTLDVSALAGALQEDLLPERDRRRRADDDQLEEARREKSLIRYTGFIAQEVEQAARRSGYDFSGIDRPQNDRDLYGLRYAEFVVPLVKATQEQQDEIDRLRQDNTFLKEENQDLHARLDELELLVQRLIERTPQAEEPQTQTILLQSEPRLEQNRPNPFKAETAILYYIPERVTRAQLRITTPDGKILRLTEITTRGPGQTILQTRDLPAGTYTYTLILDGRVMESRQMVLQR